ncbi:MAG TPA: DUF1569 domain-containing protein [Phnomibacter sp.]|nr:DUF1569 domain-containing protein [Phnomibacter sp.]
MSLPNIFDFSVVEKICQRITKLSPDKKPLWGTMHAAQMLAHCNVTYEYVFEPEKHKPARGIRKLLLKFLVKKMVVSAKPYKHNSPTGPDFKITTDKNFEEEQSRLISFLHKVQVLGADHFNGKESHSFGRLSTTEWNNMFYKHVDHHLRQFGV